MSKFFKFAVAVVVALFATTSLSACTSTNHIHMDHVSGVIDVRTEGEFASGHLQGAINIDVEASDFASKVNTLDHAGDYVIYCHSGRRAGIALTNMQSLGFIGTLTNAGGIDEAASATGLPIVQ